jgi:glycosyltransferase involved in cell wall biosynthesis
MTWHLVSPEFPPFIGGISTWADAVATCLHEAGEPVVVHIPARIVPLPRPFPVYRMAGRQWSRWAGWWARLSVLPHLRPGDRILCATWPLATGLVGRGFPVGIAFHGSDLTRPHRHPHRDRTLDAADRLLPVSDYLGGLLQGRPYHRLPYPIRLEAPVERGEALLTVARLVPQKAIHRVLELGQHLGRPVRVVGDGPLRADLERYAQKLDVPVTFFGALAPEKIPWAGSWALALLSEAHPDGSGAEGLGLVLLEAAARGLPTLGSRVGGIPEAAWYTFPDPNSFTIPTPPPPQELQQTLKERHSQEACLLELKKLGTRSVDKV